jgi:hypothetical protein
VPILPVNMQEHSDPTRKRSQLYYLNIQLLDWIDGAGALGGRCSGFDGRTRQVKVLQVGGIVGRPLASRRFLLGRRPPPLLLAIIAMAIVAAFLWLFLVALDR